MVRGSGGRSGNGSGSGSGSGKVVGDDEESVIGKWPKGQVFYFYFIFSRCFFLGIGRELGRYLPYLHCL